MKGRNPLLIDAIVACEGNGANLGFRTRTAVRLGSLKRVFLSDFLRTRNISAPKSTKCAIVIS
jgi:hypothetical protein